ncbi:ImmA/IrrE family metallo-endopeptidase [Glutamicibacter ardleyensis]|uniref:ImmA/IrrE family metallo-endopeptidase n=1 Tax=Glutamicibacter ardleyensis TaxID=225894 RepID=UPI003FD08080
MFDPWQIVSENPWIEIHHVRMPNGKPGATDGHSIIWLDDRLTATERRCVLTHELVHLNHGHNECQPPKIERRVRTETAHILIRWTTLAESTTSNSNLTSLADELHVTRQVLEDRLHALSELEIEMIRERGVTISADATW